MDYKVVYEVTSESMKLYFLLPLLFAFIGIGIVTFDIKKKNKDFNTIIHIIFGSIIGALGLLASVMVLPSQINEYFTIKNIYINKQYQVLEGVIENFRPMPYSGHSHESFRLNGVKFDYSDFDDSYYGFHNCLTSTIFTC